MKNDIEDEVINGEHDDAYSEYIMDQTPIGNGDMLINAMESGAYLEGFCDQLKAKRNHED